MLRSSGKKVKETLKSCHFIGSLNFKSQQNKTTNIKSFLTGTKFHFIRVVINNKKKKKIEKHVKVRELLFSFLLLI